MIINREEIRKNVIHNILEDAVTYISFAMDIQRSKRPHKFKRQLKYLMSSRELLITANDIDTCIDVGIEHFKENSRHRSFNIQIGDIPMFTVTKGIAIGRSIHFNYYRAIRFRKVKRKDGEVEIIGYFGKFCPYGRFTHAKIVEGELLKKCPNCKKFSMRRTETKSLPRKKYKWICGNGSACGGVVLDDISSRNERLQNK